MSTTKSESKSTVLTPPIDIYELNDVINVIAELPGVNSDNLNIQLNDNTLTIEGVLAIATADGEQEGSEEIRTPYYVRTLQLSDDLNKDNIGANFKDGILTLTLVKKAKSKPQKIDVQFS